jgi:malate dehydrogenase (oxaloacetate-decarboxylating)(NADP+)
MERPLRPSSPSAVSPPPNGLTGIRLLHDPRYNRGTGFTAAEREALGLRGLLPPRVISMEQQAMRVIRNLEYEPSPLGRYINLTALLDRNEALFYRVLIDNLTALVPIVYTPTVGEACRFFGHIFRRPRGLYVSLGDRGRVRALLDNWPQERVSIVVMTDGERILGLGDLGASGMGIPIGKLALYTACAGVHPSGCLPIVLDVGTDNEELLADPLYTGCLRKRLRGPGYADLVDELVTALQDRYPGVIVQFEDFATDNAFALLARYRRRVPSFNDDIQGTAAVTLAGLMGAGRVAGRRLTDERLLFLGAGSAATGVADLVVAALRERGLSDGDARSRCWFVDSRGLVVASRAGLAAHKLPYAHEHAGAATLHAAIDTLRPTVLLGLSAQAGAFDEPAIRAMARHHDRPAVFALSNPTSKAECTAEEAYRWSDGRAVFASGSPFGPVELGGRRLVPGQGNNAYIFPGVGLGAILCGAREITEGMFLAAATTLAGLVDAESLDRGTVYPPLTEIRLASARIAEAVIGVARQADLTSRPVPEDVRSWVEESMYDPRY